MPTREARRSTTIDLGGRTVRQVGVPSFVPTPPGGDDLQVYELNANTILTVNGIYIVDTSVGNRTITLPILSGTPVAGYDIKCIRKGSNFLYIEPNAADTFWDFTTQKTIFDDNGAYAVTVGENGTVWQELGRFRTVT